MKIIDYSNRHHITVEFQDKYKTRVETRWQIFENGSIKNPYYPDVYNKGIVGNKYPVNINGNITKEYYSWANLMRRCFDEKLKEKRPTYKDATCCEEWLLYENFYEWLHSQENFEQWYNGYRWAVDKDILVKGNKIYSPETCCLVPTKVNNLFIKSDAIRGDLPIGVYEKNNVYYGHFIYGTHNNRQKTTAYSYPTPEDAFYLGYKPTKEKYIKQVAQEEYDKGNIIKRCYESMMNYQVEITD